ncbi:MAG TPA: 4-alpha-glucanotransferase [Candidatus Obscuribacterales bacterium]
MIDTKEKLAGLLIPAFALRRQSGGDLGIGDTQAIKEAIDFCARNNTAVLQLLPINETGGDNSPYNAISSIALDPVLLTIAPSVPGLTADNLNKLSTPEMVLQLSSGPVNYPVVKKLKLALLRTACNAFLQTDSRSPQRSEFETFKKQQQSWLANYSLFRTLVDVNGGNTSWPQWPEAHRCAESAQQWVDKQTNSKQLKADKEFYCFVQWVASRQWADVRVHADAHGVRLMGDIPFGVSRYSADVWANQKLFDLDWSGGAPPEKFFQSDPFTAKWGQNWGLPLYRWDEHKAENFQWWHQRVRKCVEIFHYFRIDHVLGFFRIYSFPWQPERNGEFVELNEEQAAAKSGGRLPQFMPRSDERPEDAQKNAAEGKALLKMILDASGKAGVVAEDLGMVPDYVRPILQELGIPGFTIPFWEREDNRELKKGTALPVLSLATYATHDHQPLVVLYREMVQRWHGPEGHDGWLEMQRLMRFLSLDENNPPGEYSPELHRAFLKSLLETPCWLVVLMITELLSTQERFNQPGTSGESNWSRRLDHSLDWYEKNEPFSDRVAMFRQLVKETRRLPLAGQVGTIR